MEPRAETTRELDALELRALVSRLEEGIAQTGDTFRRGMIWISALFFAMAALYGVQSHWDIAALVAAVGVVLVVFFRRAVRRNEPRDMAPVLAAISVQPDRIVKIRHYTTSDSRRIFVSHWIEARTDERRLLVRANHDWRILLERLARRCPQAEIIDGA